MRHALTISSGTDGFIRSGPPSLLATTLLLAAELNLARSSALMWTETVASWAQLMVMVTTLAAIVVAVVVLAGNNHVRDGD